MKNESKTWKSLFLFALRTLILIKIFLVASPAFAQSRLGGIRNEVRKESHAEPEQKGERKRPSSSERKQKPREVHDDNHEHDHDRNGRRDNHPRRKRSGFGHSHVSFFTSAAPTQIIHTREIHVIDPVPVCPSPVVQTFVPRQNTYQSVIEPGEQILMEEPVYQDVYVSKFQNWGGRITGWYGGGIDDISQGNLSFLFQNPGGMGLDGNVRTIRESGFNDHLWMGDLNLVYEPVCSDVFRLRIGAGFNWLADSWGSDFGFNLTSGFDAKLTDRLIFGGEVDLGNLGHSDYLHAQLSLGYQMENVEFVVGYDHTNIGDVSLDSPFAGLRFRF